ncbi:MAG: hypothetical protein RTU63_11005 [Candidatus Thorarchaeota archaeon]
MRGNRVSIVLALITIGFVIGSAYSFMVPYEIDRMILIGDNFGILDDLTAPFHTSYPWRSHNQSIDILFACTEGALDIIVLKGTEWNAWYTGENYSAYYEARNVTSAMITVRIEPSELHTIDIILQTNYGEVRMDISIYSHCWAYNDSAGVTSLLVAIPFAIGSFYYAPRKSKNDDKSVGIGIS